MANLLRRCAQSCWSQLIHHHQQPTAIAQKRCVFTSPVMSMPKTRKRRKRYPFFWLQDKYRAYYDENLTPQNEEFFQQFLKNKYSLGDSASPSKTSQERYAGLSHTVSGTGSTVSPALYNGSGVLPQKKISSFFATHNALLEPGTPLLASHPWNIQNNSYSMIQKRDFHAAGSKVHYLDFRHRFKTHHLRIRLLIIRRQKMKKHQRRKWRRKFKCLIAKTRLKREIAKEKAFRVELLTMIREAENFDPKEYALRKIAEINSKPKELSKEEKLEELKELIRKNRHQVDYIKPKHRRADI